MAVDEDRPRGCRIRGRDVDQYGRGQPRQAHHLHRRPVDVAILRPLRHQFGRRVHVAGVLPLRVERRRKVRDPGELHQERQDV